jgi:hypothetical protein
MFSGFVAFTGRSSRFFFVFLCALFSVFCFGSKNKNAMKVLLRRVMWFASFPSLEIEIFVAFHSVICLTYCFDFSCVAYSRGLYD